MKGLRLETERGYWVLEGDTDLPTFLRALPILISGKAFLYFEGGSPDGKLKDWMNRNMIELPEQVARGTIWPRCEVIHIALTESTIEELALIAQRIAHPELAIHAHVYEPGRMILEWHDAFDNPILIDARIDEDQVTEFARAIGFTVTKQTDSEGGGGHGGGTPPSRPAAGRGRHDWEPPMECEVPGKLSVASGGRACSSFGCRWPRPYPPLKS